MNHVAKLLGRKFYVSFIVQQNGNLKKRPLIFFVCLFVVVFVHGYGPGVQIKFVSILNLEVFIINKLVDGW